MPPEESSNRRSDPNDTIFITRDPPQQLGPYRIEARLGAGGMGTVYRGTDTRLGRPVAVKLVAQEFSSRFEREARAISALNHPRICTLYDIGPGYLVMELVEGETLAQRLKRGPLALSAVLRFGAELADALSAAHAKGIIHRDLKPGNIMLTKSGVKVLDFGLAKCAESDESLTATNLVMGTPAYMAPEQSQGSPCDTRTDIYALGLVLFEMATGKRLRHDWQPADLQKFPPALSHVLERCLAEEPEERWQSAKDLATELNWAEQLQDKGGHHQASPARSRRWIVPAALVVCAASFAAALSLLTRGEESPSGLPARFTIALDQALDTFETAVPSPDGRFIVFPGMDDDGGIALWLRPLDAIDAQRLPGTDGGKRPFWSPDGRWIGYYADGKLKKVSPDGKSSQVIVALPGLQRATWGAKGDIVYQPANRGPLFRVRESGGAPQQITEIDAGLTENSHRSPVFLPDGRRYLFLARCTNRDQNAVYIAAVDSARVRRRLMPVQSNVQYVPPRDGSPGLLLFYRDNSLMAQAFDADEEKLASEPEPVIADVSYKATSTLASFEVSASGSVVVFRPTGADQTRLVWFDRRGQEIGVTGPRGSYEQPRISPDNTRIAFTREDNDTGNRDVWLIEIERGVAARITTHPANDWFPAWSPDGRRIVFGSDRDGGIAIPPFIKQSLEISGSERPLIALDTYQPDNASVDGRSTQPYDWSVDGRWMSLGSFDIWFAPVSATGKPFAFLATRFTEGGARFSPDGKWIAYASDESGRSEVYVRRFQEGAAASEGKFQISNGGGDYPVWRRDGQELFYMAGDLHLYAVNTANLASPGAAPPTPTKLFRPCLDTDLWATPLSREPWTYQYDTLDGKRFVFNCRAEPSGRFVVLVNWKPGSQ